MTATAVCSGSRARRGCTDDPIVRQELVELYVLERILALLGMRIREALVSGRAPGPEGSVAKLAATALGKRAASLGMALAGPGSLAWSDDASDGGDQATALLFAPMLGIAGGTTEIQKNIIGERVLGLPKDPAVDKDVPFRDLLVGTREVVTSRPGSSASARRRTPRARRARRGRAGARTPRRWPTGA